MNQRHFHRVSFSAPSTLVHQNIIYRGRLDNISLRGAMVSADECIMIPLGDTCTLTFCPTEGVPPIVVTAEVRHSFFSMVGVKFVAFADDAEARLYELMKSLTSEPAKLQREWEVMVTHGAGQQRPAYLQKLTLAGAALEEKDESTESAQAECAAMRRSAGT